MTLRDIFFVRKLVYYNTAQFFLKVPVSFFFLVTWRIGIKRMTDWKVELFSNLTCEMMLVWRGCDWLMRRAQVDQWCCSSGRWRWWCCAVLPLTTEWPIVADEPRSTWGMLFTLGKEPGGGVLRGPWHWISYSMDETLAPPSLNCWFEFFLSWCTCRFFLKLKVFWMMVRNSLLVNCECLWFTELTSRRM